MTNPYVILYGVGGWAQRWEIAPDQVEKTQGQLDSVGQDVVGHLPVVDPQTDAPATLVVNWAAVAAAVIVASDSALPGGQQTGQYA